MIAKHNGSLFALVTVMITFVAIEICVMHLQPAVTAVAISGEELRSVRGGNGSLTIMANESYNPSSYNKDWPNIHSNVETDFNTNVTFPEIQETAFIHPFVIHKFVQKILYKV